MAEAEKARLAQLIGEDEDDTDSVELSEADRKRMAELLRRSASEDADVTSPRPLAGRALTLDSVEEVDDDELVEEVDEALAEAAKVAQEELEGKAVEEAAAEEAAADTAREEPTEKAVDDEAADTAREEPKEEALALDDEATATAREELKEEADALRAATADKPPPTSNAPRAPVVVTVVATRKAEDSDDLQVRRVDEEDELDYKRVKQQNPMAVAEARRLATEHDSQSPSGIVLECVWENETLDVGVLDGAKLRLMQAAPASWPAAQVDMQRTWRPCRGNARRGPDSRPAFESPTRVELAEKFVLAGGPPIGDDASTLPDSRSWRWLSPWQVDSSVHGSDRVVIGDSPAPDAWLYAPNWPRDEVGYQVTDLDARVRCRRWVRPRERTSAHALLDTFLAESDDDDAVLSAMAAHRDDDGLIDLDAVLTDLGYVVEPDELLAPPPPPPPRRGVAVPPPAREAPNVDETDGVVVDFVWENQRWRPGGKTGVLGGGTWAAGTLVRRPPFEASRPVLATLFRKFNGPPSLEAEVMVDNAGLPGTENDALTEWRWLGPWVVDSASFGIDRTLADVDAHSQPGKDGWLYAFDWPREDRGYRAAQDTKSFVRCRRWVRPREKHNKPPPSTASSPAPVKDAAKNLKLFE